MDNHIKDLIEELVESDYLNEHGTLDDSYVMYGSIEVSMRGGIVNVWMSQSAFFPLYIKDLLSCFLKDTEFRFDYSNLIGDRVNSFTSDIIKRETVQQLKNHIAVHSFDEWLSGQIAKHMETPLKLKTTGEI